MIGYLYHVTFAYAYLNSILHFHVETYNKSSLSQAIIALCLATSLNGAKYSGHGILPLDMSPNYAGALVGLSGTAGNLMGFMAPYAAGVIIDGQVR